MTKNEFIEERVKKFSEKYSELVIPIAYEFTTDGEKKEIESAVSVRNEVYRFLRQSLEEAWGNGWTEGYMKKDSGFVQST